MEFISKDIYNLIYIAVILLGGVTLTLTIILRAKERDKQHSAICIFVGSIFIYMVTDFLTYYYLGGNASDELVFALITASDTFFCLLVAAWIYLITVLIKIDDKIKPKWVFTISFIYLISSQILSIDLGRYDSYALQVTDGIGKIILQIIDAAYVLVVIGIGIYCLKQLISKYRKGSSKTVNTIMVLLLIGYMIWIAYWDYNTWYKLEENLLEIYAGDPLILMYAIFNGFLIYYFYRKDPLHIAESQVASEDAIEVIVQRYDLSRREKEVLEHINRGMSNKQIAAELKISENTVKRHVNNIFRKTETQGRYEIVYKIANIGKSEISKIKR